MEELHANGSWLTGTDHDGKSLESLVTLLRNRLTFIFHEISDEASWYTPCSRYSTAEVSRYRGSIVSRAC